MMCSDVTEYQRAILTFFETKVKKSKLYKANEKVLNKEIELRKYSSEKDRLKHEKSLNKLKEKYDEQVKDSLKNEIPNFLSESSNKAQEESSKNKGVLKNVPTLKVTHPTKFTSGEIPAAGIYIKPERKIPSSYLATDTLKSPYYDLSHQNGALITHTRFLMVNLDTDTVYDKLEKSDYSWLLDFSVNENQVKQWEEGLKCWVEQIELKDAYGLKQIYFPVGNGLYHMIAPLFSSSLCQSIHENIVFSKYDPLNKKARKAKSINEYVENHLIAYPKLAVIGFGGSQPQNITAGNFERHGKAFLLSCSPPVWQSSLNPPFKLASLFEGEFDYRVKRQIKELKEFLIKVERVDSNFKIRARVKKMVNHIVGDLFSYVAEIQNLSEYVGWSENASNLPEHHKLWLDPFRDDESFCAARCHGEWQEQICRDFGLWLNKNLESKKVAFTKFESDSWALMLQPQLKEFERDLEACI